MNTTLERFKSVDDLKVGDVLVWNLTDSRYRYDGIVGGKVKITCISSGKSYYYPANSSCLATSTKVEREVKVNPYAMNDGERYGIGQRVLPHLTVAERDKLVMDVVACLVQGRLSDEDRQPPSWTSLRPVKQAIAKLNEPPKPTFKVGDIVRLRACAGGALHNSWWGTLGQVQGKDSHDYYTVKVPTPSTIGLTTLKVGDNNMELVK